MTVPFRYDSGMTLLSVQTQGLIHCAILLLLCVIVVHGFRLAKIGYRTMKKKPEPPKPDPAPEPVYYLVERKKKRVKQELGEPRKIRFQ